MDLRRFGSNVITLNDSVIGTGLRQSRPVLATATAVAVATVALTLILTTRSGQQFDQGRGLTYTLATIGSLFLGFVVAYVPGTGVTLGFRLAPRQGWLFWFWIAPAIGLIQLAAVLIWEQVSPGMSLAGAEAQTWQRFFATCLIAPVAEEIVYRMILCPPAVALARSWGAIVISGVAFAYAHYAAGRASPDNLTGGFVLAWVFVKSETIILPIALHAVSNLFLFIVSAMLLTGTPAAPAVPPEKKHPAEAMGIRSTNFGLQTTIKFLNESKQTIKVYWLDLDGHRKLAGPLKHGQYYEDTKTSPTHVWLITDENDNAWYVYLPDAQPRTVEIVAPENLH
jgi:membrane protease YdiL (CAAX protease family)